MEYNLDLNASPLPEEDERIHEEHIEKQSADKRKDEPEKSKKGTSPKSIWDNPQKAINRAAEFTRDMDRCGLIGTKEALNKWTEYAHDMGFSLPNIEDLSDEDLSCYRAQNLKQLLAAAVVISQRLLDKEIKLTKFKNIVAQLVEENKTIRTTLERTQTKEVADLKAKIAKEREYYVSGFEAFRRRAAAEFPDKNFDSFAVDDDTESVAEDLMEEEDRY